MKVAAFVALGVLLAIFLFIWLLTSIRYKIGSRYFKIKLFGLCLRRIPFEDIHYVTKRPPSDWSENWWNTLHPKHRLLVVRRYRGLFRNIVITPRNRYVFKAELEKALKRIDSPATDPREDMVVPSE